MKFSNLIVIVLLLVGLLCGCAADEEKSKKNSLDKITQEELHDSQLQETTFEELRDSQLQEIKDLFYENQHYLETIKDFLYSDKSVKNINPDGYIVYEDGNVKWFEDISLTVKHIKSLKGSFSCVIFQCGNLDGEPYITIDTEYPDTEMFCMIRFSRTDLTKESKMYSKLDEEWYLHESYKI